MSEHQITIEEIDDTEGNGRHVPPAPEVANVDDTEGNGKRPPGATS